MKIHTSIMAAMAMVAALFCGCHKCDNCCGCCDKCSCCLDKCSADHHCDCGCPDCICGDKK